MSNSSAEKINVQQWLEENTSQFVPPVCNKLMFKFLYAFFFLNLFRCFDFRLGIMNN